MNSVAPETIEYFPKCEQTQVQAGRIFPIAYGYVFRTEG